MRRIKTFITLSALAMSVVFSSGCASMGKTLLDPMQLGSLLLATGAGYVGYNETRDESRDTQMLVTAAAAGGTYLVAQYLAGQVDAEKVKEFNAGYSLGASNAAKTQYWIIQNRHKAEANLSSRKAVKYKYYALPGPEYDSDGVKLVPHDVVIRVVE